jgi:hypothetical protein
MALWHWILGGIGAWYLLKPAPVASNTIPVAPSGRVMSAAENEMFVAISNVLNAPVMGKVCAELTDVTITEGYTTVKFTADNQAGMVARPISTDVEGEAKAFATSICSGG